MSMSKVLKGFMLGLLVLMLSACGGGSSTGTDANTTTAPTAQALAIQAIATYAQEGGMAPSVEVYATAGVSGIDATNLDAANALVLTLVYEDVDTVEEIQALVDGLNANTAPVATTQTLTTNEDTPITFSATDADGDKLTYTVTTQPTHGIIVNNTYTPNANCFGADSFSFVVNDGTVDSSEATVSITVNATPMATAQSITLDEDTTSKVTLSGTDPDNDGIAYYTITVFPQHGYLTGYTNNWTYIPNQNYHGEDSFSFTVNDGKANSLPATIDLTVTPVNDAPFAYNSNYKLAKNSAVTIELNATDVDNTPDEITYTITSQPTNGSYDATTKTYTPATDFTGVDSFTYTATDPDGLSSTATVYVNVGIVAPYITTWKTDNEGNTTDTQIKIGTYSGSTYNFTVEWGDGSTDENVTQSIVHDYGTAGTYTVKISGVYPHPFNGNYYNSSSSDYYKNFDAPKLLSVEQWGDMAWKSMSYAFSRASNMLGNASDIPDLSAVTDMHSMFSNASSFNQDLNAWDVSAVTNMGSMFFGARAFNQDIGDWDVSAVSTMSSMFYNARAFNQSIGDWNVSSVTNIYSMFLYASAFNQDLSTWDVSAVTSMDSMFSDTRAFNQDLSTWNVSSVTNMSGMFAGASSFNQDLSNWDVSSVTNMSGMFAEASSFNQDLSTWDVSSVTNMRSMFSFTRTFDQDLSNWEVSSVTYMSAMFSEASAFNQDLSTWDVSSVTYMHYMFAGASSFNQDLSAWDVSSVTYMRYMFAGASSFNQDISDWDISPSTNITGMFDTTYTLPS